MRLQMVLYKGFRRYFVLAWQTQQTGVLLADVEAAFLLDKFLNLNCMQLVFDAAEPCVQIFGHFSDLSLLLAYRLVYEFQHLNHLSVCLSSNHAL